MTHMLVLGFKSTYGKYLKEIKSLKGNKLEECKKE